MKFSYTILTISSILGIATVLASAVALFWVNTKSRYRKEVSDEQSTLIDLLRTDVKRLQEQHAAEKVINLENTKKIAHLEGELKTYREIPLTEIASNLELINKSLQVGLENQQGIMRELDIKSRSKV